VIEHSDDYSDECNDEHSDECTDECNDEYSDELWRVTLVHLYVSPVISLYEQ
jgi:hypothetical protein